MPDNIAARLKALAIAIGLVIGAMAIQWVLRPITGPRVSYGFFYPALAIAAMWLGPRLGVFVLVAGLLHSAYWYEPVGLARVNDPADVVAMGVYLLVGGILLVIGARARVLRQRTQAAEAGLERQVCDLQALQELGARVMPMHDLAAQLRTILTTLCGLLDASKAVATVRDPREREIAVVTVGEAAGDARVHKRALLNMQGEDFGDISLHFDEPGPLSARDEQVIKLCILMASGLAERHMLLADAMQLSRQVEIALESSAVPFCLVHPVRDDRGCNTDFTWEYLNGAARRAFQFGDRDLVGLSARATFPAAWEEPGLVEHLWSVVDSGRSVEFEIQMQSQRARPWFRVIASACEGGLAMWFSNVTPRKQQEEALREADRRKDEFLATLAHELRNPLAPIRQATVIARSPSASQEQREWSLRVIDRQVGNMSVLLDDLLDVSRITRGKLELRREPTDLRTVLDSALEAAQPVFDARRQHLHVQAAPREVWCDIDPIRIAQVVGNLLTNASKYSHSGGNVWLETRNEGDHALVEVRDDGVGIPAESLDAIFGMFTQLSNPHSSTTVGLGIGLALARGLAQMHGATLTAHSEGPGRGSTFTLRLPTCAAPAAPRTQAPVREHPAAHRRVLVADDNRDAAESLAEVLRMAGHEVELAFDGEMALEKFREFAPAIALLNIGMPGMSGNEVAAAVRREREGRDTILVAITGWGQERDRVAAREAGFDFHFTKPVNPAEVLDLVADAERAPAG